MTSWTEMRRQDFDLAEPLTLFDVDDVPAAPIPADPGTLFAEPERAYPALRLVPELPKAPGCAKCGQHPTSVTHTGHDWTGTMRTHKYQLPRPTVEDARARLVQLDSGRWTHPDPAGNCKLADRGHPGHGAALSCELDSLNCAWKRERANA